MGAPAGRGRSGRSGSGRRRLAGALKCHPKLPFGCGSKPMVLFWGRCTTQFRPILVEIGMFTGGPIWILTHGHLAVAPRHESKWCLGSKPCTPGEHQNWWQMDAHPPQNGAIGYAVMPHGQMAPGVHSPTTKLG